MRLTTLLASLTLCTSLFAEHLPGGDITYHCIGNSQYEITLKLWRECSGVPIIAQLSLIHISEPTRPY